MIDTPAGAIFGRLAARPNPVLGMLRGTRHSPLVAVISAVLLLGAWDSAEAFRCKSRVVRDGMHEAEVIRLCGEPVSVRDLGFVVRSFSYGRRSLLSTSRHQARDYPYYQSEVRVTEMLFNFGPRRLMRRVRFEDGFVTSIRTMGYGYIKKDR